MRVDRISLLALAAAGIWFTLVIRTFQIQVIESSYYSSRAEGQAVRREIWKPERGRIMDREGRMLAVNAGEPQIAKRSGGRIYPGGTLASQVLGRVGADGRGQMGVEYRFDEKLRGVDGWTYLTLDASRNVRPGWERGGVEPTPGLDLILTIDKDIQEITELALRRGVAKLQADRACAVVMDPRTGEVLALATYPEFDPNDPVTLKAGGTRNDPISMVYEPGSTFKLITAGAALEEGVVKPLDLFDATGGKLVLANGETINDTHDNGIVTVQRAMAVSSNVAFAKIAEKVGQERFYRFVRQFGLGAPTGIELPGEERGMVKPVHQWSGRTLVTMAMGHEILVTPLQMAAAFATAANGGMLVRPTLVKEWRNQHTGEVVSKEAPGMVRRVLSTETAAELRTMLRMVVSEGTAKNVDSKIVSLAGKTGTAEKYSVERGGYDRSSMNSSFVGMAPFNDPHYLTLVLVDQPRTVTVGGLTAGPIFKEIMERVHYAPSTSPATYRLAHVAPPAGCKEGDPAGLPQTMAEVEVRMGGCLPKVVGRGSQVVEATRISARTGPDTVLLRMGDMPHGTMPDLRGMSLREAVRLLGVLGAEVQYAGQGWVTEQSPAPAEPLRAGSRCYLKLKGES